MVIEDAVLLGPLVSEEWLPHSAVVGQAIRFAADDRLSYTASTSRVVIEVSLNLPQITQVYWHLELLLSIEGALLVLTIHAARLEAVCSSREAVRPRVSR